jgi:ribosomal protein L20A (L18A)
MKLHQITIANFRGVDRFDVAFDVNGVTIVEGDNEIGKSCIPEALQLVLEALDSAKSKAIKDVKPVHLDVAPEVTVDISTGPYRFVLEKRWLRQPSTTLTVTAPRREQLTGRDAHNRVQAILDETLDHDLWNALNVEQGGDLALPNFNVAALGRALDAAAGGHVSTNHDDDLWKRIVAERDRYWTASGRPKADRTALDERLEQATNQVATITTDLAQLDSDVAEVARLTAALPGLKTQLDASRQLHADLDTRWRAAELATTALRAAQSEHDAATSNSNRAAELRAQRHALIADNDRAAAAVAALETEQANAAPAALVTEARHRDATTAVENARSEYAAAETVSRITAADTNYLRQQIEIEQVTERLDQVRDADVRLLAASTIIDSVAVTPDLLVEIEARHLESVRADAALGRGAAVVEVEALAATVLNIDGTSISLASGDTHDAKVSGGFRLELPGTLRLTINAGSDSHELAATAERLRRRYRDACRDAGVTDVAEARARLTERQTAEQQAVAARATIKTALRDLTVDELSRKVVSLGAAIAEYQATRPSEPALPASHDEAQARERTAAAELAEWRAALERLETERAGVADDLQQLQLGSATTSATLAGQQQALDTLAQRLADARAETGDDSFDADVVATAEQLEAAVIDLERASQQVADNDIELLSNLIANAKAATTRLDDAIAANQQLRTESRARLELRGDEGLQRQLDQAQTELDHLIREHASLERRAAAALLLHDVAAECREEIRRRYHEPFRQQIERLGSILVGDTFEIELDHDLRVARRTLAGITLDFDQLSAGAREQLGIISRLACATIVSEHGGAPVILDDTLGWTDPTRLAAMGAIIAVAGKDCQVIVLTCTPGRYASVGNADIVRLTRTSPAGAGAAGTGPLDERTQC